jgi:hypothetical protein
MINSLKSSLQYLIKIESNFNKLVFKNLGLNISVNSFHTLNVIPETSRDICFTEESPNSDRNNGNFNNTSEISMSMGVDAINVENYRSAQLSDVIKDLNIGSLIPLKCGHNGLLSQEELELYSLYLLNSKFVT